MITVPVMRKTHFWEVTYLPETNKTKFKTTEPVDIKGEDIGFEEFEVTGNVVAFKESIIDAYAVGFDAGKQGMRKVVMDRLSTFKMVINSI